MPELIDRIELRKDFCDMCEAMQPEMIDCKKKGCLSMQIIDEQPTIEAEPVRHGRWMFHEQKNGYLWKCSKCKGNFDQKYSYCPHCGARMDGGADNG